MPKEGRGEAHSLDCDARSPDAPSSLAIQTQWYSRRNPPARQTRRRLKPCCRISASPSISTSTSTSNGNGNGGGWVRGEREQASVDSGRGHVMPLVQAPLS